MGTITGLGGAFIKANDPKTLAAWYQDFLGIPFNGKSYIDMQFTDSEGKLTTGYNVLSFFPQHSTYFSPSEKQVMINLRLKGFDELLEELKSKGVELIGEPIREEYGKFAWIMDPEGNKIELWEPPA